MGLYQPGTKVTEHYQSGLTGLEKLKQTCILQNRPKIIKTKNGSVYASYKCDKCYDRGFIYIIKHTNELSYQDVDGGYYLAVQNCECMRSPVQRG